MGVKTFIHKGTFSISYCIVLGLLFLYFSQQILPAGSAVGTVCLGLLIACGIYAWLLSFFNRRRPAPVKALSWFYLFFCIVWLVSPKSVFSLEMGRVSTITLFKNTSMFCLMLFLGYRMGLGGRMSDRQNLVACLVVTLTAVLQFVIVGNNIIKEGELGSDFTNNGGYCMVTAIPFLVPAMKRYRLTAIVCFFILFAGVIVSVKRGAMLCMTVMLIYYYLFLPGRNERSKWRRVLMLSLIMLSAVGALMLEAAHNIYVHGRIMETLAGGMSGRDHIYSDCLEAWMGEESIQILFFGRGTSSTIATAGNYAHSDWLELLTDTGLAGVILYAAFFILAFRFVNSSHRRNDSHARFMMNLLLLLTFCQSLFSMGFVAIFNCWSSMLWGIYAGNLHVTPRRGVWQPPRGALSHTPPPASCRGRDC